MAGKKSKITETLEKIRTTGKGGGTTEAALTLLNEFGLGNGEWCLDAKPQLERIEEWYEYVPLFVRVLAALKLHTLGYLPTSGGVDRKLNLDDRRFGHCKKHGALLAVTQVGKGRLIAFGTSQLRNELNEAAVRSFVAQQEREPSYVEKQELLFVTAQNVRKALEYLEDLGMGFRADHEDTPLRDLKETPEGKLRLKKLSGDNKIRIYLYLRPQPSKVPQGSLIGLPSRVISKELKPLYNVLFGLKLEIDAEAFAFDSDLQATIRAELEERENLMRERDETLRQAILIRYPNAAPQASTVLNPIDQQQSDRQRPNLEQGGNDTAAGRRTVDTSSPVSEQESGSPPSPEIGLVSRPRRGARVSANSNAPASSEGGRDLLSCDEAFAALVVAAFCERGRPSPNLKQVAAVQHAIPDMPEAREAFGEMLRARMPKIKNPGVLSSLVEEFNLAWPAVEAQRKKMQQARRCHRCDGTGLLGVPFLENLSDALVYVESGVEYCDCAEGLITRDLVEAELLRKGVKVS